MLKWLGSVQSILWRLVILVLVTLSQFGNEFRFVRVNVIRLGENPAGWIPVSDPAVTI